jgi:hypothetical protein
VALGNKKIELDFKLLRSYCEAGCTQEEILSALNISPKTLYTRVEEEFGVTWKQFYYAARDRGLADLRLAQHEKAVNQGNMFMLIWLGKQRLGQYDRQAIAVQTDINITPEQISQLPIDVIEQIRKNPQNAPYLLAAIGVNKNTANLIEHNIDINSNAIIDTDAISN